MVTLTGAPGVGKSRLALELARELADGYADGAWLVELAPLGDGALLPGAVASALSVGEVPGQSFADAIVARIGERRVLIVLDNCEHLIGACAELVDTLLGGCPELLILATSRERLGLQGERVWPVAPLAVPARGEPAEALMNYPAVCLFIERAGAVQPGFALNAYVAPAVAEICRRLDGIPLAIELAAARVEILTPGEIARRLDDRFGLLSTRSTGVLPRHRMLLAALDWSHELLSAGESALLRRLSVFVGGFCLQAAEAVCAGELVETAEVLELLSRLVSKSLVVSDTANSRGRYRLLETIRAYGSDKLEHAGEAAALREAHACFYLAVAEEAEPHLTGPGQVQTLENLDLERDNLLGALEWSLGHDRGEWALRLAGSLVLFWRARCHFSVGRDLLEAALSASGGDAPTLRAKALWGAGFLTLMAGDREPAVPLLEESLFSFREQGDLQGCSRALLVLGNCNQYRVGASVMPLLEESAVLAREAGDPWCLSHALGVAGFENALRGELPAARAAFEECLEIGREAQDDQALRVGLIGLASVSVHQGDYRSAEALLLEAVRVARELREPYGEAQALLYLGWLELYRGDYARATGLLDDAFAMLPQSTATGDEVAVLMLLGRVAHAAGDPTGAREHFERGLVRAGPAPPILALQYMGDLAAENGDPGEGRRLLEVALTRARTVDQKDLMAQALHSLGRLARSAGESAQAVALHRQALELQRQIGAAHAIVASVEALAGLEAAGGRHHHPARLLAAADRHRQENGYALLPWESSRRDADLEQIRRSLSAEEFETAIAESAALSIEQAAIAACNGCGRLAGSIRGWPSLTVSERRVAAMVAEGLTNAEIAERLCITVGTVKNHLSHIFSKLGVARRTEVAREVWRRDQQTSESS